MIGELIPPNGFFSCRPNFQELANHLKSLGATYVVSDKAIQSRQRDEFEWSKAVENKGIILGLNCVGGKSTPFMTKLLRYKYINI